MKSSFQRKLAEPHLLNNGVTLFSSSMSASKRLLDEEIVDFILLRVSIKISLFLTTADSVRIEVLEDR